MKKLEDARIVRVLVEKDGFYKGELALLVMKDNTYPEEPYYVQEITDSSMKACNYFTKTELEFVQ